jgi:hypothetical protein
MFGGRRVLPNFPTQPEEADTGYDVDFLGQGVPLFVQYKRSEVMTRLSAAERKQHPGQWSKPIYRMHLHGHNGFRQHYLMQALEDAGNMAVYITSQVGSKAMLNEHYEAGRIMDGARMFLPSEIVLPSVHERHHVAFDTVGAMHRVYSQSGEPAESRLRTEKDLIGMVGEQRGRSRELKEGGLRLFVDELLGLGPEGLAERQRRRRPMTVKGRVDRRDDELSGRFSDESAIERDAATSISYEFLRNLDPVESVIKRAAIVAHHFADAHLLLLGESASVADAT